MIYFLPFYLSVLSIPQNIRPQADVSPIKLMKLLFIWRRTSPLPEKHKFSPSAKINLPQNVHTTRKTFLK